MAGLCLMDGDPRGGDQAGETNSLRHVIIESHEWATRYVEAGSLSALSLKREGKSWVASQFGTLAALAMAHFEVRLLGSGFMVGLGGKRGAQRR